MSKERDRLHKRLDETLDLLDAEPDVGTRWLLFIKALDAIFDLIAGTP